MVLSHYGMNIKYLKNPSQKEQIAAVARNPENIGYINPTEKTQIRAYDLSKSIMFNKLALADDRR